MCAVEARAAVLSDGRQARVLALNKLKEIRRRSSQGEIDPEGNPKPPKPYFPSTLKQNPRPNMYLTSMCSRALECCVKTEQKLLENLLFQQKEKQLSDMCALAKAAGVDKNPQIINPKP